MNRSTTASLLAVCFGWFGLVLAPSVARAQYPAPCYYPPTVNSYYAAPVQPVTPFVGSSYAFTPPAYSNSYYAPTYSSFYGPAYRTPVGTSLYLQPGPYYYTRTSSYTPGYYSYYYAPGYFRY